MFLGWNCWMIWIVAKLLQSCCLICTFPPAVSDYSYFLTLSQHLLVSVFLPAAILLGIKLYLTGGLIGSSLIANNACYLCIFLGRLLIFISSYLLCGFLGVSIYIMISVFISEFLVYTFN